MEDIEKENPVPAEETATPEIIPETTPAPKHRYADRLAKAFPDRQFNSDEDYEAGMDEHLNNLESYKEKGTVANQKLISLFEAEPQVAEIVRDMLDGASFREALARHISPEDLTAVEGDPDYEGWNKNKTTREESAAKRMQFENDYANNLSVSQQEIQDWAQENNLDEAKVGELIDKIDGILQDFSAGKITKQALTAMNKALSYDTDIANAATTAEIAGRNQKIVAEKEEKPSKTGDGLPKIAGSTEKPALNKPAPSYMSQLVEHEKQRKVL